MKARSPDYAIGEDLPVPVDIDWSQAAIQTVRQKLSVHAASKNSKHPAVKAALKTMAGRAEVEHRRTDPFERARTFLRRKGFSPVCCLSRVHHVGCHRFDSEQAVMDFARSKGWEG